MTFDEDRVPATVDEAIDMLVSTMNTEEKDAFTGVGGATIHHGLGTHVRNTWSFWEQGTPLQQDFIKRFGLFGHADDMSTIIIASAQVKIAGGNVALEQQRLAERFRQHWTRMGLNPLTGEHVRDMDKEVRITMTIHPDGRIEYL